MQQKATFANNLTQPVTLHIKYPVDDFKCWKSLFDMNSTDHKQAGVCRYQICQPIDDHNYVFLDLDFYDLDKAKALLNTLQQIWELVEEELNVNARAYIVETIEAKEY